MESTEQPQLEPTILVIFGITGDLAGRYLLPALYHLFKDKLLHEHTEIIGLTRQGLNADELFDKVELCINEADNICDPEALKAIKEKTHLIRFDPAKLDDYKGLHKHLHELEERHGLCMNRLYYLSIPPKLFPETVQHLAAADLNTSCRHGVAKTRLLVEKPFGADLASAQKLISITNEAFHEDQVYRIDHYLAKETVQNILAFRQHNPIFATIWDNQHIASIDILASEQIGVANRAGFYEGVGALRDVVQNHLLQLLAVTTMELPDELTSESVHASKQKLLQDIEAAHPRGARRGQYDGYLEEVKQHDSTTETFAEVRLHIDNHRWRGVPLTITTGKMLAEKRTEITVTFTSAADKKANSLTFRIQPNEGIHVQLRVKKPGFDDALADATMDFSYRQTFGTDSSHPDAYERVLVDAIKGDHTLFATSGEVLESWRILDPIVEAWQHDADGLRVYDRGSAGPARHGLLK